MTRTYLHDAKQAIRKFLEVAVLSLCLFLSIQHDNIVIGSEKLPVKDSLPTPEVQRFKIEPPQLLEEKPQNIKTDLQSQHKEKPVAEIIHETLPVTEAVELVPQPKVKTSERKKNISKESAQKAPVPAAQPKNSLPGSRSPEPLIPVKKILQIHSNHSEQSEERVTIILTGFFPPQTHVIEGNEPRIICDFPDVRMEKNIQRLIDVSGRYVKRIRTGIHPSPNPKTRVVLDLVPEKDYEVEQLFYEKGNTYTLVIRPKPL